MNEISILNLKYLGQVLYKRVDEGITEVRYNGYGWSVEDRVGVSTLLRADTMKNTDIWDGHDNIYLTADDAINETNPIDFQSIRIDDLITEDQLFMLGVDNYEVEEVIITLYYWDGYKVENIQYAMKNFNIRVNNEQNISIELGGQYRRQLAKKSKGRQTYYYSYIECLKDNEVKIFKF